MDIVVVGNGKIGKNLSSMLVNEGHNITIVDCDASAISKSQNSQDLMCIEGNGATAEVQKEAGVNKADLLVATTPFDELNMMCCLIARKLGCKKTISRVRNPEYYKQIDLIKDDLGLSMVINPERNTADEIRRILVFPSAVKVEVFEKGRVELVEHVIPENSLIADLSLIDIYKKTKLKFLICAVVRNDEVFIPTGDFVLQAGDRIHLAASHKDIERFFRSSGVMKDKVKTVMIVGGGKICVYLANQLINIGMRVKIIEKDYDLCQELAELIPKAVIIHGNGAVEDLLMEEGIMDADSFVALTGFDEQNILMSLYAKNNTGTKVITKVNDESYIKLASQLGLDCLISPKNITSSNILSYVRSQENTSESNIESLYNLVGNQVEAIEFNIRDNIPDVVGISFKDLKLKENILICAIIRKREVIIPNGDDSIQLGDAVVIVTKEHHISDIRDILL
ncbi:MAG: Trk system potassium transporter TrkA [Ruminococcus sp.]|nr:Trk system potassium transporter TrkA [Ruminococcus sp.]